jgi:hypothetical protein
VAPSLSRITSAITSRLREDREVAITATTGTTTTTTTTAVARRHTPSEVHKADEIWSAPTVG